MIEFGNWLNYTAMGLGNHDFDDSIGGLAPFAQAAQFPLLAANINETGGAAHHLLPGRLYNRSAVFHVRGVPVGIIGYITRTTEYNFPDRDLVFLDEVESVRAEAELLYSQGVRVLIALGHSGYEVDRELARRVGRLDLVVGGHSHSFLYTPADAADIPADTPEGPYPTYVMNEEILGKMIPVVQAKAFTKYLGELRLRFDAEGDLLLPVEGTGVVFARPHLMDSSVEPDKQTLEKMAVWQANLTEYKEVVGSTLVEVKEEDSDSVESNMGNLLTDSMAAVYENTTIAFLNNGGIRNRFEVGNITLEDILFVLPFENTVDLLEMPGRALRLALERAATKLDPADPTKYPGFGLQMAGLKVRITVSGANSGSRVQQILVKSVADGEYEELVEEQMYRVAIGSFLAPAGRQRSRRGIFDDLEGTTYTPGRVVDAAALQDWVAKMSPLSPQVEGRLTVTYDTTDTNGGVGKTKAVGILWLLTVVVTVLWQASRF
jgi:5'-nucleotidase